MLQLHTHSQRSSQHCLLVWHKCLWIAPCVHQVFKQHSVLLLSTYPIFHSEEAFTTCSGITCGLSETSELSRAARDAEPCFSAHPYCLGKRETDTRMPPPSKATRATSHAIDFWGLSLWVWDLCSLHCSVESGVSHQSLESHLNHVHFKRYFLNAQF